MDVGFDNALLLSADDKRQAAYAAAGPVASPCGKTTADKFTTKSLFFCLVLDNPFNEPAPARQGIVEFHAQRSLDPGGPVAFMEDNDLLLVQKPNEAPRAPTKFEKAIEIVLRLQKRGFNLEPANMLVDSTSERSLAELDTFPGNTFQNYSLHRQGLIVSPDGDEMYIKLHASRSVLLNFAAVQGVVLNTHPYSFGGGAPMAYSKEQERKLDDSVRLFCEAFPELADIEDEDGNTLTKKPTGFVLDVPDKMRLAARLVRESWQFGGCGIQVAEMKNLGVMVRHFFPLHNPHYQEVYGLLQWAKLGQMLSLHPFYQVEEHVVKYFGESVALYFVWIRKYTLFLRYIAFFGLIAGIMGALSRIDALHNDMPLSLINMVFSVICCVWGVAWIFKWRRTEQEFALRYGQDAQVGQELVRDEFQMKDDPVELQVEDIYRLKFEYPLTLRHRPDGAMMQLGDNRTKRLLIRYLVSYPAVLALAAGMVTGLYYTTYWRFSYPDDQVVSYASSVCTILIGFVFGVLFDKVIGGLNSFENNRTETEQEEQTISKSFLFYFLSYYFALFTIALWPSDILDSQRLDQLASQMLVITVAKPMVQNITELITPWLKAQIRIRTDINGGSTCAGICSLLRCQSINENPDEVYACERAKEGRRLWLEAQMEPYESTSGDYLEITLQYGYMTMFAATFPWAAVAAFIYNLLEIRIDARKILTECQRPVARPASSIGAWNGIFFFLSALSVVTNGYLIAIMSPAPKKMNLPIDESARYKIFTVTQYIIIAAFFIISVWFSGHSTNYGKLKSKFHILSNRATRERLAMTLRMKAHKHDLQAMA